jgi:hypothetical protein
MNTYNAYGLSIQSELPLPELIASQAAGEITIRLDKGRDEALPAVDQTGWIELSRQQAILYVDQVGVFKLIEGREVVVNPLAEVRESLLRLCILGPVMGVLLYQRGKLVLHASVLDFDGNAVAFMGGSGWGKSSLAAALLRSGHDLISDDVAPVELSDGMATILPGLFRLKIDLEVAETLNIESEDLLILDPANRKKDWRVAPNGSTHPTLLKQIYVLGVDHCSHIAPIRPQAGVIELVRHSYPTRVNFPGDAVHLQQCVQLADQVPMAHLYRTEDLSALPQLADMVEKDFLQVQGRNQQ